MKKGLVSSGLVPAVIIERRSMRRCSRTSSLSSAGSSGRYGLELRRPPQRDRRTVAEERLDVSARDRLNQLR